MASARCEVDGHRCHVYGSGVVKVYVVDVHGRATRELTLWLPGESAEDRARA